VSDYVSTGQLTSSITGLAASGYLSSSQLATNISTVSSFSRVINTSTMNVSSIGRAVDIIGTVYASGGLVLKDKNTLLSDWAINITSTNELTQGIIMGYNNNTNNAMDLHYHYITSGASTNRVAIGHYNNGNILNINANGRVGVGTIVPTTTFEVIGSAQVSTMNINTVSTQQVNVSTVVSRSVIASALMYPNVSPRTVSTSTTTVVDTDTYIINNYNGPSPGQNMQITLPTASSYTGRSIYIKNNQITPNQTGVVSTGAPNVVPVSGVGTTNTILAISSGIWVLLVSNGTNWVIMAS
jgi:hypothetical protein